MRICVWVGEIGDEESSDLEGCCEVCDVVCPLEGSLEEFDFVLVMVPRTEGASCCGWIVQMSTTVLMIENNN